MVVWAELSLAKKGCRSKPSSGKETWVLILVENINSCLKRFRWIHRIWTGETDMRRQWILVFTLTD